jgi:hypothetical protein
VDQALTRNSACCIEPTRNPLTFGIACALTREATREVKKLNRSLSAPALEPALPTRQSRDEKATKGIVVIKNQNRGFTRLDGTRSPVLELRIISQLRAAMLIKIGHAAACLGNAIFSPESL